jgi:hypothetical protein
MAFIDMACKCGSALQLDGLTDEYIMLMSARFAESHVSCGFMTSTTIDSPERRTKRRINLTNLTSDNDEED